MIFSLIHRILIWFTEALMTHIVEAEMSHKLGWRYLFVQIELGMDIALLGIK